MQQRKNKGMLFYTLTKFLAIKSRLVHGITKFRRPVFLRFPNLTGTGSVLGIRLAWSDPEPTES